jgi:hypothetical protein
MGLWPPNNASPGKEKQGPDIGFVSSARILRRSSTNLAKPTGNTKLLPGLRSFCVWVPHSFGKREKPWPYMGFYMARFLPVLVLVTATVSFICGNPSICNHGQCSFVTVQSALVYQQYVWLGSMDTDEAVLVPNCTFTLTVLTPRFVIQTAPDWVTQIVLSMLAGKSAVKPVPLSVPPQNEQVPVESGTSPQIRRLTLASGVIWHSH